MPSRRRERRDAVRKGSLRLCRIRARYLARNRCLLLPWQTRGPVVVGWGEAVYGRVVPGLHLRLRRRGSHRTSRNHGGPAGRGLGQL